MISIEGTYTSIKSQELVDFLISIGVCKDIAKKVLGSFWTLKMFKDEELWGCYLRCKELPQLSLWNSLCEGEEKRIDHSLFGGFAKLVMKMNSSHDGFCISIDTENHGKLTLESKFSEDGCLMTLSCKGKTVEGFWERRVKVEGCYIYDKGENVEAYYKAVGESNILKHIKEYKVHMHVHGKTYRMSEYYGDLGRCSNSLELDIETPFRVPGDKPGFTPASRAVLSRVSPGKFVCMFRSKHGTLEEWKLSFDKEGMTMRGHDISSGVTCKIHLKRFWEMVGTYNMIKMVGFERFATTVGELSVTDCTDMINDYSTKLVISDLGDGGYRHQVVRKKCPIDVTFRMNEEFSYLHPVVKEKVKVMPKMTDESTLCLTLHTSMGTILKKFYFTNDFVVQSVSLPEAHMRYKIIFMRASH